MENSEVIIVCGATATGKSRYAIQLATSFPSVNILSADSRQFYKDLPIVSGQDVVSDLPESVTLYGQGILKPDELSNVGDFQKYAKEVFEKSKQENKKLIVVGGSGLYLKAITENLEKTQVPPDPTFRKTADKLDISDLQDKLKNLNQELFDSLNNSDVNNPRRLIRHIETQLYYQTHPQSSEMSLLQEYGFSASWIGLRKSPEKLLQSISERVVSRLENGAIDEVRLLLKKYPDTKLPIYSTLGVQEIIKHINGEISREELIKTWITADNNYAKRQNVWFKKQSGIVWYDNDI